MSNNASHRLYKPLDIEKVREFEWTDKDFKFLASLLNEKTGIILNEKKKEMMYGRLVRRLRALKIESFSDYCQFLQSPAGETELGFTLNAITTNKTDFFREMHHFDYLREVIIPPVREQIAHSPNYHFRIWSAGCSSGQEPYSAAMVMKHSLGNKVANCKILATDLDSNMLNAGKKGIYDAEKCRETIPKVYASSYMKRVKSSEGDMMEMSEELKNIISFKQLNLLHEWPMQGKFDVIFCRNVMIYFDKETQDNLVRRYAQYLKPEGILFIGHSESLLSTPDVFKCLGKTIYRLLP
ncbi:MAG: protein-glutamate O-methyltransferase [Emcibacter sp.]|nr:protein-glutamate O-methyltransferase [Emcibacter sp.]